MLQSKRRKMYLKGEYRFSDLKLKRNYEKLVIQQMMNPLHKSLLW